MEFFKNLKFAWNYAKDQKKNLIWFIIVNILIIIISVVVPILSAKIIVYLTDNEFHQLLLIAIIILLVEWFRNICNYFKRHNSNILFRETYVNLQTSLGKEILKIDLNTNKEYTVKGYLGDVVLEVKNKKIRVKEETSDKHICSKEGYIYTNNKSLVCMPNKIIVKIISEDNDLDGVVY